MIGSIAFLTPCVAANPFVIMPSEGVWSMHPHLQLCRLRRPSYACRFIRTEEDDKNGQPWEIVLAQKYYSKLFREYAVVDLSRHKVGFSSEICPRSYLFNVNFAIRITYLTFQWLIQYY